MITSLIREVVLIILPIRLILLGLPIIRGSSNLISINIGLLLIFSIIKVYYKVIYKYVLNRIINILIKL